MNRELATVCLGALASGVRLDVYRLLVRKGPAGLVAGEIATACDLPPANLSFHLKALTQVGMLRVEQEGRFQRYRANLPLMLELIAYLTEECCSDHPGQCADLGAVSMCAAAVPPASSSSQDTRER